MKEKLHPHNGVPKRTYSFFRWEVECPTLKEAKKLKKMELFYKLRIAKSNFIRLRERVKRILVEDDYLKRRIRQLEKRTV